MTDKDPCIKWGSDAVCTSPTTYRDGGGSKFIIGHLPGGFTDSSISHDIKTNADYCMVTNTKEHLVLMILFHIQHNFTKQFKRCGMLFVLPAKVSYTVLVWNNLNETNKSGLQM